MVLAGTSVLLAGCGGSSFQALPVQEAAVKKVEFTEDIQTVSTLEAKDLVALAAQAGGRIDELKIAQGDLVEAGQLLLVLDQEQENARLRSEVAKAETDKLNYQRYEYLASQGAVSEMQRDQRRQAYISSRERAIAQQATVGYSNLTSPMAGTVADVKVKLGDVLRQGDVFTLLVKNNTLKARIDIPAKFGDRVEVGQTVKLMKPGVSEPIATSTVSSAPSTQPSNPEPRGCSSKPSLRIPTAACEPANGYSPAFNWAAKSLMPCPSPRWPPHRARTLCFALAASSS